ncbi:MAG TPA: sulfotransferase [Gaiellaceae bacterium]|nr:sulfotransferase [Gaiellaceae bacterium]
MPVSAPLVLLGVSRSGTTLLRVILDRSPGIAIPDESFFVPLLARRHGRTVDAPRFLDDLARIRAIRDWGISVASLAPRIRSGMPIGEAIAVIYEAYANAAGKPRWGDKTPMYMRHLVLLDELFPSAQYVHLIRDGRDAALSFLQMPEGTFTRTWAHPRTPAQFACLWRKEVGDARALGGRIGATRYHEVRYEALVADPDGTVRGICAFAGIPFEPVMLDYAGAVDVSSKPHQQRLLAPPTTGVRSWREDLSAADVAAFEAVAGDLLRELEYEVTSQSGPGPRTALTRGWYDARLAAWNASASLLQRSPLWRRRHPRLST